MKQPKRLLLLRRCGLMWLRYVIFTTLIICIFVCNFLFHISRILMYILSFQGDPKALALRKKGCPNYDKLRQLFAPNTTIDSLQISSNMPTPDSDEERALEEELANEVRCTQLGNDDCYNPNMEGISQDDPPISKKT